MTSLTSPADFVIQLFEGETFKKKKKKNKKITFHDERPLNEAGGAVTSPVLANVLRAGVFNNNKFKWLHEGNI